MNTRVIDLTVSELVGIIRDNVPAPVVEKERKYVYGIDGIAEIFQCSRPTAQRIKNSGRINKAISQVGRKITVDVEKALELRKLK